MRFHVGWHRERSHDFLSKEGAWARLDAERLCDISQEESMLDIPYFFRRLERPVADCLPGGGFRLRYAPDGAPPPYVVVEPVP